MRVLAVDPAVVKTRDHLRCDPGCTGWLTRLALAQFKWKTSSGWTQGGCNTSAARIVNWATWRRGRVITCIYNSNSYPN